LTHGLELLHSLTESDIEPWFDPAVLAQARRLFRDGHVYVPVRQGNVLAAEVEGHDNLYYDVAIGVTDDLVQAACNCDSPGHCEHVGAVLLNWINDPQEFVLVGDAPPSGFLDFVRDLIADREGEEPIGARHRAPALEEALPGPGDATAFAAQMEAAVEKDLRELLAKQTVRQLRVIARRRGWKLRGTRKDELLDQLLQLYLEAQDTADLVSVLDDSHRVVIEFLALRASAIPAPEGVVRKTIRSLQVRRSDREVTAVLQDLQELGLVFVVKSYAGAAYRMPAVVVRQLPSWPDLLASFKGDPARLDVRQSPVFALTQVAYQAWQYLQEPPTPKKARALPKPTWIEQQWPGLQGWLNPADELAELERMGSRFWYRVRQLHISVQPLPPALSEADLAELRQRTAVTDDILDFVLSLLTSMGLVQWNYGSQVQINEDGMTSFLSHSDVDRLWVFTAAWMNLNWWTEMALVLRHMNHLRLCRNLELVSFTYSDLTQELAQARMIVVTLLRRLSPGEWYGVADFRRLLRRFWPDYLHAGATLPRLWWLEAAGSDYRLSPDKTADWEAGYAPFVTACLEGPLAWLGVVTLGYDRQGLAAFQITDLGAYLLGLRKSYDQAVTEPAGLALTIHGDGTVLARTGYATVGAYDLLNVVGQLEATSAEQFRYRITAATAQCAFDRGWTGQAILGELEKHSDSPVPEPLRDRILTWAEGYGQVHLYDEVTLVEFADDFALRELLASTSLAQHLVYQFSPRLVAIKTESVDALRDELVHLGHTPRIE
jgi:hypothetical protein